MYIGRFLSFVFLSVFGGVGIFSFRWGVGGTVKRVTLLRLRGKGEGIVSLLGFKEGS